MLNLVMEMLDDLHEKMDDEMMDDEMMDDVNEILNVEMNNLIWT
jgi:hypothetical protein